MLFSKRPPSTTCEDRAKLHAVQRRARTELADTFEHLFAMMDETLKELRNSDPHENTDLNKKASSNGHTDER